MAPIPLARSAQKRVAIVFLPASVKPEYEISAGMISYTFLNARGYFEDSMRPALQDKVAQLEFFGGEAPGGFDVYVYPKLEMDIRSSLGSVCSVTVTFAIQTSAGRLLAKVSSTQTRSYALVARAGSECNVALAAAVVGAAVDAFGHLDES